MRSRERMQNHVQATSGYSINIWQPSCILGNRQYAPYEERMVVGRMRRGMFENQTSLFSLSVSTPLSVCSSLSYPYHLIRINKDLFYTDNGVFFSPQMCQPDRLLRAGTICWLRFVAAPHSVVARSLPVLCM